MNHFLTITDITRDELDRILDVGMRLREERSRGIPNGAILENQTLLLLFEKQSLRTRLSFEQAMIELDGRAITMQGNEVGIGTREAAADIARVASGMIHGICARVYEHRNLIELALHSEVPVINALSDESHPCQALADAMTLIDEFGRDLSGRTLAYVGDGNNVVRSLCALCGRLRIRFIVASPPGYELDAKFLTRIKSEESGVNVTLTQDPFEAVREADAIYTDTWVSMGQEEDVARRQRDFQGFQVNDTLMAAAPAHAIAMHCLPAYRNVEITDAVMDGPQSRVMPQAHNRLHAQKGLLALLLGRDQ